MWIDDDQEVELLQPFQRFRDAGDAVAGVALDEHRPDIVLLVDLVLRQQNRVEPPGQRNARRLHDLLRIETRLQVVVVDLPDPRPVPPGALGETVVER